MQFQLKISSILKSHMNDIEYSHSGPVKVIADVIVIFVG